MAASAAATRSRRSRASTMASWMSSGYGCGHTPAGVRADGVAQHVGVSMTAAISSGSSRIRRNVPAIVTNRPGCQLGADRVAHDVLEHVGLVEHDDVVLGQDHAAAADVEAVEVGVDDDDVGGRGPPPGLLGEARLAERAAIGAGALVAADAHRSPRGVRRGPVELGAVAGVGACRPTRRSGGSRRASPPPCPRARAGPRVAAVHLPQPLQADVVAAALQHRPVERHRQRRLQEGEVLAGELVLQRLRRRGHDDPRPDATAGTR